VKVSTYQRDMISSKYYRASVFIFTLSLGSISSVDALNMMHGAKSTESILFVLLWCT